MQSSVSLSGAVDKAVPNCTSSSASRALLRKFDIVDAIGEGASA